MSNEKDQRIFEYLAALEDVNNQLILALKKCVEVLAQFQNFVPDPHGWQEMLDLFEVTIREGERVATDKTLH
ncbi:MAG: hypothetical protein K9N21_02270 [Deltaproteobacteria bacterium]|nr:hypothetical protein [Deltaproteobacteria bacterium]